MKVVVRVDHGSILRITRKLDARVETVLNAGRGQVETSMRRKESWEKERAPHGGHIANILKKLGHDPFGYPDSIIEQVGGKLSAAVEAALQRCDSLGKSQEATLHRALKIGAESLSLWAIQNLKSGGLGSNTIKHQRWKRKLLHRTPPSATGAYGDPPPYGIITGRFVDGIKSTWVRGPQRRIRTVTR